MEGVKYLLIKQFDGYANLSMEPAVSITSTALLYLGALAAKIYAPVFLMPVVLPVAAVLALTVAALVILKLKGASILAYLNPDQVLEDGIIQNNLEMMKCAILQKPALANTMHRGIPISVDFNKEWTKWCFDHGATNMIEGQEQTVLGRIAAEGEVEDIKFLLNLGLDINETAANGHTPLMEAIIAGSWDAANYLLDQQADVLKCDNEDATALLHAMEYARPDREGKAPAFIERLIAINHSTLSTLITGKYKLRAFQKKRAKVIELVYQHRGRYPLGHATGDFLGHFAKAELMHSMDQGLNCRSILLELVIESDLSVQDIQSDGRNLFHQGIDDLNGILRMLQTIVQSRPEEAKAMLAEEYDGRSVEARLIHKALCNSLEEVVGKNSLQGIRAVYRTLAQEMLNFRNSQTSHS